MMMPNVASCAIFDIRTSSDDEPGAIKLDASRLLAKVAIARDHLDAGAWKVVGYQKASLRQKDWPNEQYRRRGWIGAEVYTGQIIEDFLDAFYRLLPWNMYKDPNYFDKFLAAGRSKPPDLVLKANP